MFELVRSLSVKAVGFLAPLFLRWFYKPEKLAALLKFRVRGEGHGVTFEGGDLPKVRAWLLVSNMSPFELLVDRMVVRVTFGAEVGELVDLRRRTLAPAQEAEWLIEGALTDRQLAYIQRNMQHKPETRLNLIAAVDSKLHKFESTVSMGSGNVRFMNLNM